MKRPDYLERLHKAIDLAQTRPFDYGGFNCGLFAAECIDAMEEDSHRADELRSQFHDEASAKAFVEKHGSIVAAVTARLGESSNKWWDARRGDVCLVPTQDGPGLGVCRGVTIAMMTQGVGLTHVKVDQALKVWRID